MSVYLTEIQDYFQGLAVKHTDVLDGAGSPPRRSFFRLQSSEQIDNLPNNIGPFLILVTQFNGRAVGEFDSNKMQQNVQVRFAKKYDIPADGDMDAAIEAAMGNSYLVMMDFISRMKKDFTDDSCGWLRFVDFQSLSWFEFDGPWLENHYGWDINIPFIADMPDYNSGKWTS